MVIVYFSRTLLLLVEIGGAVLSFRTFICISERMGTKTIDLVIYALFEMNVILNYEEEVQIF